MKCLFPILLFGVGSVLHAQVPQLINYQGKVAVGATNFDGTGQFKFALVNGAGTTAYWTNDGTHLDGSEPSAAVSLTVTKGLYSVLLGDATLTNMTIVPNTVFNNADVRLRVWFNDGTNGSQLLSPDQRIAAVGYAMMSGNVPDGVITGAKLADGAVTSAKLAAGAVQSGNLAPGTVFSWQNVTGTAQTAQANTGYTANNAQQVTITLPATASIGDTVSVSGAGAGGWAIAPGAGQSVLGGSAAGSSWTAHGPAKNWVKLASSANGGKLVAGAFSEYLYTSADGGSSWTARMTDAARNWNGLASSSDGTKLVGAVVGGFVYTSADSGSTWTARVTDQFRGWQAVASSADGTKLAAAAPAYGIFTSTDSGVTWTPRAGTTTQSWSGLASSADGTKLVAVGNTEQIYTSTDSGATWTPHETARVWSSVASSADGTKLVASVSGGQLYTSTDSGATWTARESARSWQTVASSADGTRLIAGVSNGGQLYTSSDSGATWTARESNRDWQAVASSSDGNYLAAAPFGNAQIYTSQQYLTGAQGSTAELQYIGNGQWQAMGQQFVANGAVGSAQIAAGSIGSTQLGSGAVAASNIASGAIGAAQLADASIGQAKLADGSISAAKIGGGQVVKSITAPLSGGGTMTLTDGITLAAGSNVSLAPSGNTITISASGTLSGTTTVITDSSLHGTGATGNALGVAVPLSLSGVPLAGEGVVGATAQSGSGAAFGLKGVSMQNQIINNGAGVFGSGDFGIGVYAQSNQGYGVFASSVSNEAGHFAGDIGITGKAVFGETSRQMINLYGSGTGIGVQHFDGRNGPEGTFYTRIDPYCDFAWYSGGSHSNTPDNPGNGGKTLMTLSSLEGLRVNYTITGTSSSGPGVFAGSSTGYGLYAISSTGTGIAGLSGTRNAIYGETSTAGEDIAGIYGKNNAVGGTGIIGKSFVHDGAGVAGVNDVSDGTGTGIYGRGSHYAAVFDGQVKINGTLTATGAKNFKIDHPLDPENKYLLHAAIESPEVKNLYDGTVTTNADGEAVVTMPEWFEALNQDFRYQLTVIGQFAQVMVASEIADNQFTIKTDKPNVNVSWQVTGIRHDAYMVAHPMIVEQDKPKDERGTYSRSEDYGQPEEKSLFWKQNPKLAERLAREAAATKAK